MKLATRNRFFPGADSGGECGVPYNAFFPFASQAEAKDVKLRDRRPWYKFSYGPVTFVQMSSEHDFTVGSEQHAWLEAALASVDRSVTPWLVFSGHRPFVSASDFASDAEEAELLRDNLEPMLLKHEVDIALWAHFHAYGKFCRLKDGACNKDGIQHLLIGMAGYEHSPCTKQEKDYIKICDDTHYGYIRMSFENEESLTIEFIDASTGQTVDRDTVQRYQVRDRRPDTAAEVTV